MSKELVSVNSHHIKRNDVALANRNEQGRRCISGSGYLRVCPSDSPRCRCGGRTPIDTGFAQASTSLACRPFSRTLQLWNQRHRGIEGNFLSPAGITSCLLFAAHRKGPAGLLLNNFCRLKSACHLGVRRSAFDRRPAKVLDPCATLLP
jgi:hypothetical protein